MNGWKLITNNINRNQIFYTGIDSKVWERTNYADIEVKLRTKLESKFESQSELLFPLVY